MLRQKEYICGVAHLLWCSSPLNFLPTSKIPERLLPLKLSTKLVIKVTSQMMASNHKKKTIDFPCTSSRAYNDK